MTLISSFLKTLMSRSTSTHSKLTSHHKVLMTAMFISVSELELLILVEDYIFALKIIRGLSQEICSDRACSIFMQGR